MAWSRHLQTMTWPDMWHPRSWPLEMADRSKATLPTNVTCGIQQDAFPIYRLGKSISNWYIISCMCIHIYIYIIMYIYHYIPYVFICQYHCMGFVWKAWKMASPFHPITSHKTIDGWQDICPLPPGKSPEATTCPPGKLAFYPAGSAWISCQYTDLDGHSSAHLQ